MPTRLKFDLKSSPTILQDRPSSNEDVQENGYLNGIPVQRILQDRNSQQAREAIGIHEKRREC